MKDQKPPAEELVRTAYARETADASILYEGMSLADIAHVIGLIESKIIPREAGGELLSVLLSMYPSRPLDFTVDPAQGDLYTNREIFIAMFTPAVGWLSTGRARREATTIGYRIAVRMRLLWLARATARWVAACLDRAEEHRKTLFPDYTYLHPAQPTAFGHYLLSFVYPALRDLDRLRAAFERTNQSPAGSGSVNGSRLPLDRASLAELLGFEEVIPHTRDAMWQADGPIEIAAIVTGLLINLGRLAEDLQIFSTAEFDLVELDPSHTRSSVIMPQKQNPYSLAYLRGLAGESIGTLAAMAAVGKTPSAQIDNRMFAYGDVPRSLDAAKDAMKLATSVLQGLTVNKDVAARRVRESFMGATDLADVILEKRAIDYKTAHRIVGEAVKRAMAAGVQTLDAEMLEAAAEAVLGKKLDLDAETIASAMEPASIVETRAGTGGASEATVMEMISACRGTVSEHEDWRNAVESKLDEAEARLVDRATGLRREPSPRVANEANEANEQGGGPPSREGRGEASNDLLKEFEGLPKMPHWRRRRWES